MIMSKHHQNRCAFEWVNSHVSVTRAFQVNRPRATEPVSGLDRISSEELLLFSLGPRQLF